MNSLRFLVANVPRNDKIQRPLIVIGLGISGFAALIYEVVWFRALSLILGSAIYAAGAMLSSFMAGLTIGAWLGGRLADKTKEPLRLFGLIQLGIGISAIVTLPLIQSLSPVYAIIYYKLRLHFIPYSIAQFFLAFFIMLAPVTFIGMTFPAALKAGAGSLKSIGREAGGLFAVNSMGSALGALTGGIFLLPSFGMNGSNVFAASVNLSLAAAFFLIAMRWKMIIPGLCGFVAALYLVSLWEPPQYYFNYYIAERVPSYEAFKKRADSVELLHRVDSPQATVEVFGIKGTDVRWLVNGGHPEGSVNTQRDTGRYVQALLSALPLGIKPDAERYLEIGLGPGNTLKTAALYPLKEITCIEINRAVMDANERYFYPELFRDKRIRFIEADARHYLNLTKDKYDVITAQPSEATEFQSGNLFTKEFYSIVKERLAPAGIFAQYISYYFLTKEQGRMMFKTWAEVFPEVYAWYLAEKGIVLVGSAGRLSIDGGSVKRSVNERLAELKDALVLGDVRQDFFWLGAGPEKVRESLADSSIPVNTDDLPLYEFILSRNILKGERHLDLEKRK